MILLILLILLIVFATLLHESCPASAQAATGQTDSNRCCEPASECIHEFPAPGEVCGPGRLPANLQVRDQELCISRLSGEEFGLPQRADDFCHVSAEEACCSPLNVKLFSD